MKTREDRSILVKNTAPQSAIWALNPELKTSGEALIQAGTDVAEGEKLVQSLQSQLESAGKQVVTLKITWDERFNVYAGHVEIVATKPEDITTLGLSLLEGASNLLAPPLSVTARWDALTNQIRVSVRKPPGSFGCRIELSPNPIAPGSFVALKGKGARRALSGYASGGWWVRALMFDNEDESDYSPPVFVTVP